MIPNTKYEKVNIKIFEFLYFMDKLINKKLIENDENKKRQIFVDVSSIYKKDAGTGIQRVVKSVCTNLLKLQNENLLINLVALNSSKKYCYIEWIDRSDCFSDKDLTPLRINKGDIFLGLDLSIHGINRNFIKLLYWKSIGLKYYFVVYDLLPLDHPEWFSEKLVKNFNIWFKNIFKLSNCIIFISKTVECNFLNKFEYKLKSSKEVISSYVMNMSGEINTLKEDPSLGIPNGFDKFIDGLKIKKTILMVGTLEPRKGHAQALSAFELLWDSNIDYQLIIVGRPGWKTDVLQNKIRSHIEINKNLIWLENLNDEALSRLYSVCDGLLMASLAEGFGLPLIEAMSYGKPILARDICVFREILGNQVTYFDTTEAGELSHIIKKWIGNNITTVSYVNQSNCKWIESTNDLLNYIKRNENI